MSRNFTAALLVLVLAACATSGPPQASVASPQVTAAPSEPNEPSPSASAPVTSGEHPATGLALVQFPGGSDDPASQIFVVEADGSLRQVTGHSTAMSGASRPAWSPDRSQIAFEGPKVGSTGVKGQIGVVNADGTGERQVSEGTNPRWSRDGSRILIEEVDDVTSEPPSMYILDIASGELTDLGQGFNPRWLADDAGISFNRAVEGEGGAFTSVLYTMSLDGGEPVELARETEAIWAPDGSAVLLVHEGTISMAAPDGSDERELVTGYSPVWSPDGSRVLFAYDVDQDGLPVLALVDLAGQELWSGVVGGSPTWAPDGSRVAVEISYPEPMVQILDAASGEILWEIEGGSQPTWDS
jgi:Tol biopolymer transport system component